MNFAHYHFVIVMLFAVVAHGADPSTQPATKSFMWKSIYGTVLHDAKRNKDLPLTLHVPDAPGPHPLIVFSHGAGGSGANYNGITTRWASRGYLVIAPTHADSTSLLPPNERRGVRAGELVRDVLTDPDGWANRARDVTFILDSLDELERLVPRLAGKIDRDRIGVAGHSYGAHTAQVIAGAKIRTKPSGELQGFADPRVKAALLMSAQGEGQMGLAEGSWDALRIPLMVMTGSEDRGAKGQDPMWRKAPFMHSAAGDKYWVFIEGATHSSFVGRLADITTGGGLRRAEDPRPQRDHKGIFHAVQQLTTAFWDAHVKDDAQAEQLLQSGKLATDASVPVTFETR